MTDHLPECPLEVHKGEDLWDDPLFGFPCWCHSLRACEQRVLDAAREAVNSMVIETVGNSVADHLRSKAIVSQALAAIDALREDK